MNGPKMTQISVVGEARTNVIPELIEALGSAGVNIETLDSQTIGPTLVAVLTVDKYDDAVRTLAQAGFHAVTEDALLVRVADKPGALAEVARRFHAAGVPLHSVRIVRRGEGWGVIALGTPRTEEALALVGDALIS